MGAVGAIVLAAIHHKELSTIGHKILIVGVIACGIGTMIGIFLTEGILFKIAFAITYFAVVWICLEAVRIPDLRGLIKQGYETTMRITTMVVFILIARPVSPWCSWASRAASGSSICLRPCPAASGDS